MRISDWSSDVCSSDLSRNVDAAPGVSRLHARLAVMPVINDDDFQVLGLLHGDRGERADAHQHFTIADKSQNLPIGLGQCQSQNHHASDSHGPPNIKITRRSEKHKSELHTLMRHPYAAF